MTYHDLKTLERNGIITVKSNEFLFDSSNTFGFRTIEVISTDAILFFTEIKGVEGLKYNGYTGFNSAYKGAGYKHADKHLNKLLSELIANKDCL